MDSELTGTSIASPKQAEVHMHLLWKEELGPATEHFDWPLEGAAGGGACIAQAPNSFEQASNEHLKSLCRYL